MKGVDEKELTTTPSANSRSILKKRKAASAKEKKKEKSIEETKKYRVLRELLSIQAHLLIQDAEQMKGNNNRKRDSSSTSKGRARYYQYQQQRPLPEAARRAGAPAREPRRAA